MIKAAIFDLDGTLYDSAALWQALPTLYLAQKGINAEETLQRPLENLSLREGMVYLRQKYGLSGTVDQLLLEYYQILRQSYQQGAPMMPGAAAFLRQLYAQGLKLCVATAAEKEMTEGALENSRVGHLLEFIVTEEEAGASKRFPDIYWLAAQRLGLEPRECLVFDDAPHAVCTAHQVGMAVCGIASQPGARRQLEETGCCQRIIGSFQELLIPRAFTQS